MSLKQATLSGAFIGRSAKTVRMPWFGYRSDFQVNSANEVSFASAVTGSTANTPGAWSQVIASTTGDTGLVCCRISGTVGATDSSFMFDLAVGASGSEVAIAQNIACGQQEFSGINPFLLPVFIPAGSRVSVRCRSGVGGRNLFPAFAFVQTQDLHVTPRSIDAIGVSTSTSRGTALSGASGTWNEITAATSQAYQSFFVVPSSGDVSGVNQQVRLTLGYGPAGSEVSIGQIAFLQQSSGTISNSNTSGMYPTTIIGFPLPAGQRLAIRHNITANPSRVQACVIGVPFR